MKISELSPLAQLQKAAQIPVAIAGENRSITLGQILSALQNTIVPFWYGWFLCHFYIIFKTLHKSSANNLFFISIWTNLSLAGYAVGAY